jgi:hypothetical protein
MTTTQRRGIVKLLDPSKEPSVLWFENGKMMIGKFVKGEWIEKEGIKDGQRYIWKDEITADA